MEGSFLQSAYEQAVRATVGMIEAYRREVIGDNLALTVFCGPAFDDEELVKMIKNSLGNPSIVSVPSYQMPKALKYFWPDYMNEKEDFSKFDSIVRKQLSARKSISSWIASAAKIRLLWEKFTEYVPGLEKEVELDQFHYDEMVRLCHDRLKVSDFEGAKAKLLVYDIPSEQTKASKFTVDSLFNERADLQQTFAAVNSIAGARYVVGEIDRYAEIALKLYEVMAAHVAGMDAAKQLITFYESHYDEYKELKRKFKAAKTVLEARSLVESMRGITLEELPALELEHVEVQLDGKYVETRSGIFGLKKQVDFVYTMKVRNREKLPCNAVINISNDTQHKVNEGDSRCIAVEIPQGESSYEGVINLPDSRISCHETLFVYIFPAPGTLDPKAIKADYLLVKKR